MIDIDKYEGHDEDWKLGHSGVSPFVHIGELTIHATNDYLQEINMGEANAQLIADAPLLLAEVKRLRKALLRIADTANGRPFIDGHMDSFVGEVLKELIE